MTNLVRRVSRVAYPSTRAAGVTRTVSVVNQTKYSMSSLAEIIHSQVHFKSRNSNVDVYSILFYNFLL